jgi:hypothetical protein
MSRFLATITSPRFSRPAQLRAEILRRPVLRAVATLRRELGSFELYVRDAPRPRKVTRGLIATGSRQLVGTPKAELAAERALEVLQHAAAGDFAWKEKAQWARRLAHWKPDWNGRRIVSEACQADCRYVARIALRAWRKGTLPKTTREWGNLRASLQRIYAELQEGA